MTQREGSWILASVFLVAWAGPLFSGCGESRHPISRDATPDQATRDAAPDRAAGVGGVHVTLGLGLLHSLGYRATRAVLELKHLATGSSRSMSLAIHGSQTSATGSNNGLRAGLWDMQARVYEWQRLVGNGSARVEVFADRVTKATFGATPLSLPPDAGRVDMRLPDMQQPDMLQPDMLQPDMLQPDAGSDGGGTTKPPEMTWTLYKGNPVIKTGGASWVAPGYGIIYGLTVLGGGSPKYRMYMAARDSVNKKRIGGATSSDGINWSLVKGPLATGAMLQDGTYMHQHITCPAVVYDSKTFHMYYKKDNNGSARYNYASSKNGLNWTKAGEVLGFKDTAANPFEKKQPGELGALTVILDGSKFMMWYVGYDGTSWRIGHATSADGSTWTRVAGPGTGKSVLDLGAAGAFDSSSVIYPTVLKDGGLYKMWYRGSSPGKTGTGYATSKDGINWIKHGQVSLGGYVPWGMSVLREGKTLKMWFNCLDNKTWNICLATTTTK